MAQLLTSPPSANLLTPIPGQGRDSNGTDTVPLEADIGAGASFAAALKTSSEKIQISNGKPLPPKHDSSALSTSILASRVLTSLSADMSIEPKEPLRSFAETSVNLVALENLATATLTASPVAISIVAPVASESMPPTLANAQSPKEVQVDQVPAPGDVVDLANGTLIGVPKLEAPSALEKALTIPRQIVEKSLGEQLPKPLTALSNDQQPTISTATTAGMISAVLPAPTFSLSKTGKLVQTDQKTPVNKTADLLPEHGLIADKFAAKAAIAAETGKAVEMSILKESGSGDFSTVMDRGIPSSAFSGMSQGQAMQDVAGPGLKLETPLGQAGWRDEFGQKLTWMVSNTRQQAELILNPPQLGRIEVTLTLDGDKASASFFSPLANVREALENSMVRLREVLAESGVTLGQTHVGENSRQNPGLMNPKHNEHALARRNGEINFSTIDSGASGDSRLTSIGRGMVDIFA